jgi:hypothetical protein
LFSIEETFSYKKYHIENIMKRTDISQLVESIITETGSDI